MMSQYFLFFYRRYHYLSRCTLDPMAVSLVMNFASIACHIKLAGHSVLPCSTAHNGSWWQFGLDPCSFTDCLLLVMAEGAVHWASKDHGRLHIILPLWRKGLSLRLINVNYSRLTSAAQRSCCCNRTAAWWGIVNHRLGSACFCTCEMYISVSIDKCICTYFRICW